MRRREITVCWNGGGEGPLAWASDGRRQPVPIEEKDAVIARLQKAAIQNGADPKTALLVAANAARGKATGLR